MRTFRIDRVEFDSSKKIVETDTEIIVPTIFTRESILPFKDGRGYRSAEQLKKYGWTLEGAWLVAYDHIPTVFPTDPDQVRGRTKNVKFCSNINGLVGDSCFLKSLCDQPFQKAVRKGDLKDVSVAYFSEDVMTPGKFGDEPYEFIQTKFFFGHLAAGVAEGRCPSPYCGMSVDSLFTKPHADPEETEEFVHIWVRDPADFVDASFRTIDIDAGKGIKAVIGKLKSDPHGYTVVQKFIFEKAKDWTMEKAEAWVSEHKDSMDAEWTTEYINDLPDSCFAYVEEGEKDDKGKTVPRSKRHLPFKNAGGEIDHDHLVNALARVKQSATMPEGGKRAAIEKLCAAVRSWNREHEENKIESEVCGTEDSADACLDPYEELARSRRYFHSNMSLFGAE